MACKGVAVLCQTFLSLSIRFRWVFCQLEMLRLCQRSRVRHLINELPDSLDETYERVLKGIHKTNQGHVQRLLQCVAMAFRPLRVDELAAILAFDPDANESEGSEVPTLGVVFTEDQEQELLATCPSLITIVDSLVDSCRSRVVQFSHFSVKEFLTSDRLATSSEDISRYHIIPDTAHTTLSQASLRVLLCVDDRVDKLKAKSIPLAEYAAEHWISHTQAEVVSSRVMGAMKILFDSDKPHFAAWVRIWDIDNLSWYRPNEKAGGPLYYSALCGFYDLVEHLVKRHPQNINAFGGRYDCPLAAALHGGHIRVAEFLFQHGANVNFQGTQEATPLHVAAAWPTNVAVDAVDFLLKRGADVDARRADLSTPLHMAPNNIIQNTQRDYAGRPSLVRRLLEYGADVNSRDVTGTSPFLAALDRPWNLDVAWVLVDHDVDVNVANIIDQTPLHLVHDSKLGRLLVERGADVNAPDKSQRTPLHQASSRLLLELVQVLLDHNVNVHAVDGWGRTPLHYVLDQKEYTDKHWLEVVQLLIAHGADVNTPDNDHETLLHRASRLVLLEEVWILLEHGADLNLKNKKGKIPFQLVQERAREKMELRSSHHTNNWEAWRSRRVECVALMGLLYSY
jgi:ankyrin repeat protein